jgi:hypothetical protein
VVSIKQVIEIQKGGELTRLVAVISALIRDNGVKVTVEILKPRRSVDQNAKLWAIYDDILKLGGEDMAEWTNDDLHEFFLIEHFGHEVKSIFGRKKMRPLRRSSKLSKLEFADFVEHIYRFMAEKGVYIA